MKTLIMHAAIVTAISLSGAAGAPVAALADDDQSTASTTTQLPGDDMTGDNVVYGLPCSILGICGTVTVDTTSSTSMGITFHWPTDKTSTLPGNAIPVDAWVARGTTKGGSRDADVDGFKTHPTCINYRYNRGSHSWDVLNKNTWYKIRDNESALIRTKC